MYSLTVDKLGFATRVGGLNVLYAYIEFIYRLFEQG